MPNAKNTDIPPLNLIPSGATVTGVTSFAAKPKRVTYVYAEAA